MDHNVKIRDVNSALIYTTCHSNEDKRVMWFIYQNLVLKVNWKVYLQKGISNIRFYNICSLPGITKVRKLRQYENIVLTPTLKEITILTQETDFGWLSPCGQARGGSIFANGLLASLLRLETWGRSQLCDTNRWPIEWRYGYQGLSHYPLSQLWRQYQSPIRHSKLEILGQAFHCRYWPTQSPAAPCQRCSS